MFAKIKDDVLIQFPYGYDELQADNPHTRFTGALDLVSLFKDSEEHILKGYDLVEIIVDDKPTTTPFPGLDDPMPLTPFHIVTLSDIPVKEADKWVLKWNIEFVAPNSEA